MSISTRYVEHRYFSKKIIASIFVAENLAAQISAKELTHRNQYSAIFGFLVFELVADGVIYLLNYLFYLSLINMSLIVIYRTLWNESLSTFPAKTADTRVVTQMLPPI